MRVRGVSFADSKEDRKLIIPGLLDTTVETEEAEAVSLYGLLLWNNLYCTWTYVRTYVRTYYQFVLFSLPLVFSLLNYLLCNRLNDKFKF